MKINKLIKLSVLSRNLEKIAADAPPSSATPPPVQAPPKLLMKLHTVFNLLSLRPQGREAIENIIRKQPDLKEIWDRIQTMSITINEPTVRKDIEKASALAVQFWRNINELQTIAEKDSKDREVTVVENLKELKRCIEEMLRLSDNSGADNNATLCAMIDLQARKALQAILKATDVSNPEEARKGVIDAINNPEYKTALNNIATGITFENLKPFENLKSLDITRSSPVKKAPASSRAHGANYKYRFKGKAREILVKIDKWFDANANLIASSIRAGLTDKLIQSGLAAKIGESQVDIVRQEIKKLIE